MAPEWHSVHTQMFSLLKSWTEIWKPHILERGIFCKIKLVISGKVKILQWSADTKDNQISICNTLWFKHKSMLWTNGSSSHYLIVSSQWDRAVRINTVVTLPMLIHPYKITNNPGASSVTARQLKVPLVLLPLAQEFILSLIWVS